MIWRPFVVALLALVSLTSLSPVSLQAKVSGCTEQVSGYQGVWFDPVNGEQEVAYLAPDHLVIRDWSSGQVHGVAGNTVWDYDPTRQEANMTYNDPHPFGPATAPGFLPGSEHLQQFLNAMQDRYRIALDGNMTVVGRGTFVVRLSPKPGKHISTERLLWVDQGTCLILREQEQAPSGALIGGTHGFTAIRYAPPELRQLEVPVFPPGTVMTNQHYGTLKELSAEAGFKLAEPSPLPTDWRFHHAHLTMYPDRGAGRLKGLSWYYYAGDRTALAVTVWSPPGLQPGTSEAVRLSPGITGYFFTARFNDWPGIRWVDGALSYSLAGPALSKEQLVELAKSMKLPF